MNIFGLIKKLGNRRFKILYSIWIIWQFAQLPLGIYKLNLLDLAFLNRNDIEYYGMLYTLIYAFEILIRWILDIICYPEELIFHRDCSMYLYKECGLRYLDSLNNVFKNNNPYDKVNQTTQYIWRIMANIKHMIEHSIGNFLIPLIWICTRDYELAIIIFSIRFFVNLVSSNLIKYIKYLNRKLNAQMVKTDTKGRIHMNALKYIHFQDSVFLDSLNQIKIGRDKNLEMDRNITYYWRIFDLTIDIPNLFLTYLIFKILSLRTDVNLTNLLLLFTQSNKLISSMQGLIHILQRYYVQNASINDFFESLGKTLKKPKTTSVIDFSNVNNITLTNVFIKLKKVKHSIKKNNKNVLSFFKWFHYKKKEITPEYVSFETKLDKIDLKLGQNTSLEGNIGTGKSSFLKALTIYNESTQNIKVLVNNKEYSINDLQSFISYYPQEQNYNEYDGASCIEVLSGFIGDKLNEDQKIKIFEEIILGICDEMPLLKPFFDDNYDIENNDLNINNFLKKDYSGIKPSGGQKSILEIISHLFKVIANSKKILIMDEIDSTIKSKDAAAIWRFLVSYVAKHKIHVIYVSHKKSTSKFSNQKVLFEKNKFPILEVNEPSSYLGDIDSES